MTRVHDVAGEERRDRVHRRDEIHEPESEREDARDYKERREDAAPSAHGYTIERATAGGDARIRARVLRREPLCRRRQP